MSKLAHIFKERKAFIAYLTAGDGGFDYSLETFLALAESGVSALEIGMPFTDPIADGPIIQAAMHRSLAAGTSQKTVLALAKEIRKKTDIPLILFTYYNPLLQAGKFFLEKLADSGFDGVLVNDLSLEEMDKHLQTMQRVQLDPILIATPASSNERLKMIASYSKGFIYYACQKGTTGLRQSIPQDLRSNIQMIKQVTDIPVAVGFGISNRQSAAEVLEVADGFVIGSAFVQLCARKTPPEDFKLLANSIRP